MDHKKTFFGRCIFLSWYCDRATCKFCFRSTIKHKIKHAKNARRSLASIVCDAVLGKYLGWRIEFLTGGYGIFEFNEIVDIARIVSNIYGEKIWVNLGVLSKEEMLKLEPYVEGICASIETINPKLHHDICPDKEIEPYTDMLYLAKELGFKTSITIVIGLGEKKEDFELLKDYIKKIDLDRITFYALKPVKGTPYTKSPSIEEYSWWISETRKSFLDIKIMAGLTPKKVDYTKDILLAGANGITKFPAVRRFNSSEANLVEEMAKEAGREFDGSLTKIPDIDWSSVVDNLDLNDELKQKVKEKVFESISKMKIKK